MTSSNIFIVSIPCAPNTLYVWLYVHVIAYMEHTQHQQCCVTPLGNSLAVRSFIYYIIHCTCDYVHVIAYMEDIQHQRCCVTPLENSLAVRSFSTRWMNTSTFNSPVVCHHTKVGARISTFYHSRKHLWYNFKPIFCYYVQVTTRTAQNGNS